MLSIVLLIKDDEIRCTWSLIHPAKTLSLLRHNIFEAPHRVVVVQAGRGEVRFKHEPVLCDIIE